MKTGIVILNYNDAVTVIGLADSIISYSTLDRIMIVDNCSTDDSFSVLSSKYQKEEKVTVVSSGRNGGYSYGNNFGAGKLIDEFDTDIIFISNGDVVFKESLISSIIEGFGKNPEYGVLTGVMKKPDGSTDPVPYRDYFSYLHDLGDCFISIRRLVYEKKVYKVDYSREIMTVPVIQGSFFAITREAFTKIQGLDENVFLYCEELILGKRLEKAEYKTGIITGESYIHNHAVSIKKSMKNIAVWKAVLRSKYYYQKNYNHANGIQLLLLRLCGGFSILEKLLIEVLRLL